MIKNKINFLEHLYNSGVLWLVLGTLISSDSYLCSTLEGIKRRKSSIKTFYCILKVIDDSNLPIEVKEEVKKCSLKGIELLSKEIEELQ